MSLSLDMYETLARYYDQLHTSLTADIPFVITLAEKQSGPVVELGCGTGRLLIPLAEHGISVTGIDNSPQMLHVARRRLALQPPPVRAMVTLIEADILNLPQAGIDGAHTLALLAYNTMLHFREMDVSRLLRGTAALLQPGARLLIDIANPFAITTADHPDGAVFETIFIDQESGARIEQWSSSILDTSAQTLSVNWSFRPDGQASEAREVAIDYHYLYPHQAVLLLQQAGFTVEHIWGSYEREPFAEDSDRLLLLARLDSKTPATLQ